MKKSVRFISGPPRPCAECHESFTPSNGSATGKRMSILRCPRCVKKEKDIKRNKKLRKE